MDLYAGFFAVAALFFLLALFTHVRGQDQGEAWRVAASASTSRCESDENARQVLSEVPAQGRHLQALPASDVE